MQCSDYLRKERPSTLAKEQNPAFEPIENQTFNCCTQITTLAIPAVLQLHLLVLIFAATTVLGRLSTLSAPVLVTWRCLLATLGAFFIAALIHKRRIWLGGRQVAQLLGVGVIMGLHWLCLFGAVKVANVSIALAGLATLSLFTAFTEPMLSRGRVKRFEVLLGLIVLVGIFLIAGAETDHWLGLTLALMSALLAAIFMVINKGIVVKGADPMTMVGWEMLAAMTTCLIAIPMFDANGLQALLFTNLMDWLWLLLLAFGCTVFAQALTNKLLREISAYKLNLAANFEPVYGIIAAAMIFQEHHQLKPTFYLGALTIIIANCLYPLLQRRFTASGSNS